MASCYGTCALAVIVLLASTSNAASSPTCSETDPLLQWLCEISIPLPEFSYSDKIFEVKFAEGSCSGLHLGGIKSKTAASSYTLNVSDVGISCIYKSALVKIAGIGKPTIAELEIANTGVNATVVLVLDKDGYVTKSVARDVSVLVDIKTLKVPDFSVVTNSKFLKDALDTFLEDEVQKLLISLIETNLTQVFSSLTKMAQGVERRVPTSPPTCSASEGAADLRQSAIVQVLDYLLDDLLNTPLEKLIKLATNGTGRIDFTNSTSFIELDIPDLATVNVSFRALQVAGLLSLDDLELLIPTQFCALNSETTLQNLELSLTINLDVIPHDNLTKVIPPLSEEFEVFVQIRNTSLDMLVALDISQFETNNLKPGQLFDPGCLLSTVNNINISWLFLDTDVSALNITALNGTAEEDLDAAVNNFVLLILNNFDTFIPLFIDEALLGVAETLTKSLNQTVLEATCAYHAPKEDPGYSVIAIYTTCGAGAAVFIVVAIYLTHRHNKIKRGSGLSHLSTEDLPLLETSSSIAPALVSEKTVPMWSKYLTPLLLLGTIGLFIVSNNSAGAQVRPGLSINGIYYEFQPLFTFDLSNTIKDMWDAHVYPLSLLVAIFSGSWPYIKLLMMLACFFLPINVLSETRREWVLRVLDALGKWSLIDTFIMVMMLVAFRFELPLLPKHKMDEEPGMTGLEIFVKPCFGFQTFLIATIASLILSHYLIYLHRRAADQHRRPQPDGQWQALGFHHFVSKGKMYRFTYGGLAFIALLLIATIGIIIVGAKTTAFTFDFKGLASAALDFEHGLMGYSETSTRNLSLLDVGANIPEVTRQPDDPRIRWIQAAFYIFGFVVPIFHMGSMLFIWLVPLPAFAQRRCFVAIEVFNAWSALDVFVVSLLATILELQQFAKFIIGDKCDAIDKLLQQLIDAGILPPHIEATCFDVIATLGDGCWYLFAAALLTDITAVLVMQLCHMALEERFHPQAHLMQTVQHDSKKILHHTEKPGCGGFFVSCALGLKLIKYEGTIA